MIVENNFAKNEPIVLKIFYAVGIICLLIKIYGFPIFDNKLDKIFGIVGYGGMFLFFKRLFIYNRKNGIDWIK